MQRPDPKAGTDQYQRFVDTARQLGCDESGEAFERAFGKIAPQKRPKTDQQGEKPEPKKPGR
jgi:hypothetical protein